MVRMNSRSTTTTWLLVRVIAVMIALNGSAHATRRTGQNETRLRLATAPQAETETPKDPPAILASARVIFVCSRTGFVKSEVIESELLKRAEFQQSGLLVTKDPKAADLVMEVRRSNFTTEYPYVVVDTRTRLVVASGRVNSLFGTAAGKIAKGFIKQVQKARTTAGVKSTK
jgi:hypothetical protein